MLLSGAMVEFQAPKEGEGAVGQHDVAVRHRCLAIFCAKISIARKSNRCVVGKDGKQIVTGRISTIWADYGGF